MVSLAEDFLYVFATSPGQRSEIQWFPAGSPESARVLIEGLDQTEVIFRHREELWWITGIRPIVGNLIGQDGARLDKFGRVAFSYLARQGDLLFWKLGNEIRSFHMKTGESGIVLSGNVRLGGLTLYEDRLYFGDGFAIESARLDGSDRRRVGLKASRLGVARGVDGLAVHDGRVIWLDGEAIRQVELQSGLTSTLTEDLPRRAIGMTVTDDAIYWIDGRSVWRWRHGDNQHELLYQLGDTRISAIASVSAHPVLATAGESGRLRVMTDADGTYQLLYSEDLRSWSPDYVQRSLFSEIGALGWLQPIPGVPDGQIAWRPKVQGRQAYFTAWRYAFEPRFDADGDELPDYWERRHFGDLSATPDVDSNGDGLTHLEEARLFLGPTSEDSDGDGLLDTEELAFDRSLNPAASDTDGDGLTDGDEVDVHGTDPLSKDTDNDGFSDSFEVDFGGEPNDRSALPSRDAVLESYAEDLLVHFDFEFANDARVPNAGLLGGYGRFVGETSFVARESQLGKSSMGLEFLSDSIVSYIETDYSLLDLGMAADDAQITFALWLRMEHRHLGTILSAARSVGPEQAIYLGVEDSLRSGPSPLGASFRGEQWSTSSLTSLAVPVGNVWTHVAWVIGRDGRTTYIDGELHVDRRDARFAALEAEPKLWLGAQQGRVRATVPFRGAMDDVRIYKRALTADTVKLLARESLWR